MIYNLKKNFLNILVLELNFCLEFFFLRRWKWFENGYDYLMDDIDRLSYKCICSDDRLLVFVCVDYFV